MGVGRFLDAVRDGTPPFRNPSGTDISPYMTTHPAAAAVFDAMMTGLTNSKGPVILSEYDMSWARTVVDVGGGQGAFIAQVLAEYPSMRGILFDRPPVIETADEVLRAAGVADRCSLADGDFFRQVPSGGDLYLLVSILHNWDDRQAAAILRSCRAAMRLGARLLAAEWLVPPGGGPRPSKILDVQMYTLFGGEERTEQELSSLFDQAGLELAATIATPAGFSLTEGRPR